jgi:hypothetical protein
MTTLRPPAPLHTAPLFPRLHAALVELLAALALDDWARPTVAGAWRVRDVAAHLLDGDLRKLAAHRDGHAVAPDGPVESYADVVALIQRLNAGGVAYGARLSPRLLADLLDVTGRWVSAFVASLDPDAPALYPVAWAGEARSDNRLDTAREYTERWHHQMQIRAAVGPRGRPDVLLAPDLLGPLLDTAACALPHAYRDAAAPDGTAVTVRVAGDPRSAWTLVRDSGRWRLHAGAPERPDAWAEAAPDVLWRLYFNALPAGRAREHVAAGGPDALLAPLWQARAVMV